MWEYEKYAWSEIQKLGKEVNKKTVIWNES
jgi:hypothetical protein